MLLWGLLLHKASPMQQVYLPRQGRMDSLDTWPTQAPRVPGQPDSQRTSRGFCLRGHKETWLKTACAVLCLLNQTSQPTHSRQQQLMQMRLIVVVKMHKQSFQLAFLNFKETRSTHSSPIQGYTLPWGCMHMYCFIVSNTEDKNRCKSLFWTPAVPAPRFCAKLLPVHTQHRMRS